MGNVIWIDGAAGAGKNTVANVLVERTGAHLLDPEQIGYAIRGGEHGEQHRDVHNYRRLPVWWELTREAVSAAAAEHAMIVVPQTISSVESFDAIVGVLRKSMRVDYFTLEAPVTTLMARIEIRPGTTGQWSIDEMPAIFEAHRDSRFGPHIDSDANSPDEIADEILRLREV